MQKKTILAKGYDGIRETLTVKLISSDAETYAGAVRHEIGEGLEATYYAILEEDEKGIKTFLITKDILKKFGVSVEQLHEDAIKNSIKKEPAEAEGLVDMVRDFIGEDLEEKTSNTTANTTVLRTKHLFGAKAIAYPGVLKSIAEKTGKDFYIIPSSIHEVLLMPMNSDINPDQIREMIHDINSTVLDKEDFLSDSLFCYDREKDRIVKEETYRAKFLC